MYIRSKALAIADTLCETSTACSVATPKEIIRKTMTCWFAHLRCIHVYLGNQCHQLHLHILNFFFDIVQNEKRLGFLFWIVEFDWCSCTARKWQYGVWHFGFPWVKYNSSSRWCCCWKLDCMADSSTKTFIPCSVFVAKISPPFVFHSAVVSAIPWLTVRHHCVLWTDKNNLLPPPSSSSASDPKQKTISIYSSGRLESVHMHSLYSTLVTHMHHIVVHTHTQPNSRV